MNILDVGQTIVSLIASAGIVYITVPLLRSVAFKLDLYDKPDGERKLHTDYVPTLGGIALFLAFFVGFSIEKSLLLINIRSTIIDYHEVFCTNLETRQQSMYCTIEKHENSHRKS